MINNELISIIVPVYNVEKYLDKCLSSIVNQTYRNIEILAIDDGSTDYSGQICDSYSIKDNRVRVFHKANGGLSDARNYGINFANGQYLCFVDSDDYIHEQYVEILYNALLKMNADISICNLKRVKEGIKLKTKLYSTELLNCSFFSRKESWYALYDAKLKIPFTVAHSKLIKKTIFENLQFSFGRNNEDEVIAHQLYNNSNGVVYTDVPLYFYLTRTGSIMNSPIVSDDAVRAMEDRMIFFKNNNEKYLFEKAFYNYLSTLMGVYSRLSQIGKNEIKLKLIGELNTTINTNMDVLKNNKALLYRVKLFKKYPAIYRLLTILKDKF